LIPLIRTIRTPGTGFFRSVTTSLGGWAAAKETRRRARFYVFIPIFPEISPKDPGIFQQDDPKLFGFQQVPQDN
jgi:hypothetical protein